MGIAANNRGFGVALTPGGTRKYMNMRLLEEMDKEAIYSAA